MICPQCRESPTQICAYPHLSADNLNDEVDVTLDELVNENRALVAQLNEACGWAMWAGMLGGELLNTQDVLVSLCNEDAAEAAKRIEAALASQPR